MSICGNNEFYGALNPTILTLNLTSEKHKLPIYTLSIFGGKLYIVNSVDLILAVQKQSKNLSFAALASKLAGTITGTTDGCRKIIEAEAQREEQDDSLVSRFFKLNHTKLGHAPTLDVMNTIAAETFANSLDAFDKQGGSRQIDLFSWISHEITQASFEGTHGPDNPMKDRKIEDSFWYMSNLCPQNRKSNDMSREYDRNIIFFLLGNLPARLIMPEALAARERLVDALEAFYLRGGLKTASTVFQARHDTTAEYGISERDVARLELGGILAVASNTGPTSFWVLYHVFSSPEVLTQLRTDLKPSVIKAPQGANGKAVYTFDFSAAKQHCPLLLGVFQETLRLHSSGATVREVKGDTWLNGQYLLKKGGILQMPSAVIHSDPAVWGADVDVFRPQRFLDKQQPGSFRGFGGGQSLCPGRHFAMKEVLVMLSLMVLKYDIKPVGGVWKKPSHMKSNMTTAIAWPKEKVLVDVVPRKEFENVEWKFEHGDAKNRIDLSAIA